MHTGCQNRMTLSLPIRADAMSGPASRVEQGKSRKESQYRGLNRKISYLTKTVVPKINNKYAKKAPLSNRGRFNRFDLHCNSVKLLKHKSIDIKNINSPQQYTNNDIPMIWAAKNNRLDVLQALISVGADVYIIDGKNNTPLSYAFFKNHQEAVELLKTKLYFYEYSKSR